MPTFTITCPECDTALRGAGQIPAGKKVKCPTCQAVFIMTEPRPESASLGIQEKPVRSAPARTIRDEKEDDEPMRRRRRVRDEEKRGEEAPTSRKPQASNDDEDIVTEEYQEDDDLEDRPRKKRRKTKLRRRSKKALVIILASVIGTLLIAGFVGAYFIWLHGTNWGGGSEDPLAFVPPDSNLLMGEDLAALASDPAFGAQFQRAMLAQAEAAGIFDQIQAENTLQITDIEQAIVAMKIDPTSGKAFGPGMGIGGMAGGIGGGRAGQPPTMTVIYRTKKPLDQKKTGGNLKDAKRTKAHGKYYYELNNPVFKTLYMVSSRTYILTTLEGAQLEPILKADPSKPAVSADALAAIRAIEKNTIWGVIPFEGKLRTDLEAGIAKDPPPAELKPLVDAALKAKSASFWAKLDTNRLNMGIGLNCADAGSASQLATQIEAGWNQFKGQLGQLDALLGLVPKTKQFVNEAVTSVQISTQGNTAQAAA